MIMVGSVRKAVGSVPAGERSKHATIAVQRTHRIARIAQIPRCAKNACSGDNPTGRNRTIQYRRRGGKSARAAGDWARGLDLPTRLANHPSTGLRAGSAHRGCGAEQNCRGFGHPREAVKDDQLTGAAPTSLSVRCGLRVFASTASAAESFRSRCGSVRGAPEWSSQTSPTAAPQVVQGTEKTWLELSSLVFITT
jgi:hypothetical protein